MNLLLAVIFLAGGVAILWKCADLLVTGAAGLAERFGVSPLVIGLTVIAMGTSAPEVAASIAAAARGTGDVAIGNVYGSNIANLALVGGLCALIWPIRIQARILRRELPAMLLVSLLLLPFLHNRYLSRPEGIALFAIFAALLVLVVHMARKENKNQPRTTNHESRTTKKIILFIVVGLAGLALGAELTVRGAVFIGQRAGLSNAVIGLTIIAIGTSLPELVTSLAASIKGHHSISIGNLVGSNIFNALLAVGAAGLIRPFQLAQRLAGVDYWIMFLVTAVFCLIAIIKKRIGRFGAIILLAGYISYIIYLLA